MAMNKYVVRKPAPPKQEVLLPAKFGKAPAPKPIGVDEDDVVDERDEVVEEHWEAKQEFRKAYREDKKKKREAPRTLDQHWGKKKKEDEEEDA